jgi:hypothetical protein
MMKTITVWLLALSVSVLPLSAQQENNASVPLGNWAKVEALRPGVVVWIRMQSKEKLEGEFLGLDANSIRLKAHGDDRSLSRTAVAEVHLKTNSAAPVFWAAAPIIAGVVGSTVVAGGMEKQAGVYLWIIGVAAGVVGYKISKKHLDKSTLIYQMADKAPSK